MPGAGPPVLSPELVDRVVRRYASCGRSVKGYVRGKLRRDPVHADILALAGREALGHVIDLGCGRGQLGVALLEAGFARSVLALDRADAPLAQARSAAIGLAFAANRIDLAEAPALPAADTVLLVDVLYQIDPAAQDRLLARIADAARRLVLIRTLDPARGLRSRLTLGFEQAVRLISPHSGLHVRPLPLARIATPLQAAGFTVAVAPCWRGTPFSNVLLTARRPE